MTPQHSTTTAALYTISPLLRRLLLIVTLFSSILLSHHASSSSYTPSFSQYHNYAELTQMLQYFESQYPMHTRLFSIGKSVENREMHMIQLFNNDSTTTPTSATSATTTTLTASQLLLLNDYLMERRPNFRFVSNMHGDEPMGKELILRMTQYLLSMSSISLSSSDTGTSSSSRDRKSVV